MEAGKSVENARVLHGISAEQIKIRNFSNKASTLFPEKRESERVRRWPQTPIHPRGAHPHGRVRGEPTHPRTARSSAEGEAEKEVRNAHTFACARLYSYAYEIDIKSCANTVFAHAEAHRSRDK